MRSLLLNQTHTNGSELNIDQFHLPVVKNSTNLNCSAELVVVPKRVVPQGDSAKIERIDSCSTYLVILPCFVAFSLG